MSDFYEIAHTLLNERVLTINGDEHTLAEIEIYLNSSEDPDPYVHKHPDQLTQGNFYFHKASRKKDSKFKGGTFKGVDLTFGNKDTYCGILIRSIISSNGTLITGPCKVVDYILQCYEVQSIADLVSESKLLSFLGNKYNLVLEECSNKENTLYSGPRVGLGDKDPYWRDMPLRFSLINKGIKLCTQLQVASA